MANTDTSTMVMAIGTTVSAVATIFLAIVTWRLTSATKKLVETTKQEGVQNAEANQRSYQLALHQIDLHSKTLVYEEILQFLSDDFLHVQELATALGVSFVGISAGKKLGEKEKVARGGLLITKISLNGSEVIADRFLKWMELINEIMAVFLPYIAKDAYGKQYLAATAPPIPEIQEAFDYFYRRLQEDFEGITGVMRDELRPSELAVNPPEIRNV